MVKPFRIAIDGPLNECFSFRPLPDRVIRGAFSFARMREPMAKLMTSSWPLPIPGQQIGIDADGVGYIVEPLHDPENAAIKEKIIKDGMRLAPATEVFENIDVSSWAFWLKSAVEAGIAHLVKGELPTKIEGKPKLNYITGEPEKSDSETLTAAIERQTAVMEKLLEKLAK